MERKDIQNKIIENSEDEKSKEFIKNYKENSKELETIEEDRRQEVVYNNNTFEEDVDLLNKNKSQENYFNNNEKIDEKYEEILSDEPKEQIKNEINRDNNILNERESINNEEEIDCNKKDNDTENKESLIEKTELKESSEEKQEIEIESIDEYIETKEKITEIYCNKRDFYEESKNNKPQENLLSVEIQEYTKFDKSRDELENLDLKELRENYLKLKIKYENEQKVLEEEKLSLQNKIKQIDLKLEKINGEKETFSKILKDQERNNQNVVDDEISVTKYDDHHINQYKDQYEKDIQEYEKLWQYYLKWSLKINKLVTEIKDKEENLNNYIEKFNKKYKELENFLIDEKDKKILISRQKGINIIKKMYTNLVSKIDDKVFSDKVIKSELLSINDMENINDLDIQKIMNSNYNKISSLKNTSENLIRKYFKIISEDILPICDGVQTGIDVIEKDNLDNKELLFEIKEIYKRISNEFKFLNDKLGVEKIIVNKIDTYNPLEHEVFDIEETTEINLDEKIFEIIRDGYCYIEPVFDENKHIIRPTQVIVYKFKEDK